MGWRRGQAYSQDLRDRVLVCDELSAAAVAGRFDDRPLIDRPLIASPLGGRDQWPDQRPLLIRQVTRVAQLAAVIPTTVLVRPRPAACELAPPLSNYK